MSTKGQPDYDDSYPTCVETYSTLRVFSDDLHPDEITKLLQIEPTESFRKGDSHALGKLQRKTNGWFYSTEKLSSSKVQTPARNTSHISVARLPHNSA